MEEIEVGEYVRTIDGRIIKFNKFGTFRVGCREPIYYKTIVSGRSHYKFDNIIKHSKNIIDLIEVGDYVNGKEVIMDLQKSKEWYKSKDDFITCKDYTFEEKEIKRVVTKEQFNSIAYRLEE